MIVTCCCLLLSRSWAFPCLQGVLCPHFGGDSKGCLWSGQSPVVLQGAPVTVAAVLTAAAPSVRVLQHVCSMGYNSTRAATLGAASIWDGCRQVGVRCIATPFQLDLAYSRWSTRSYCGSFGSCVWLTSDVPHGSAMLVWFWGLH